MRYLVGLTLIGGKINWQDTSNLGGQHEEAGLKINFPYYSHVSRYDALRIIEKNLHDNNVDWIFKDRLGWLFDSDKFKKFFPEFVNEDWLKGIIRPEIEMEHKKEKIFDREQDRTFCRFIIAPNMIEDQMSKRIFLSHKGLNKSIVRQYKNVLETVGLSPWLDEDAMHAGVELERGILKGFEDSCAAVFFITPEFKDEKYLASEINYAIAQKRIKEDRFSIITLVFHDDNSERCSVPGLLKPYVWKEPVSELVAITEIIRALPIRIGDLGWR